MKITSGFVALTVIVFVFSTCKNRVAETANSLSPRPSLVAPSTPDLSPTPLASEYGSVRQIDFENFRTNDYLFEVSIYGTDIKKVP